VKLVRMRTRVPLTTRVSLELVAPRAPALVGANRACAAIPVGWCAVAVRSVAVPVSRRTGVPVGRARPVLVRTRIPELFRPVIRPVATVWPRHSWLRIRLPFLPAALPVRRPSRLPVVIFRIRLCPLLGAQAGLGGIAVSRRQRIRPHWPELAQPILGRGFAEVGLRPLVSGPPAEYHLCRHPATKNHPAPSTTSVLLHDRPACPACRLRLARTKLHRLGPRCSDWPRRSPGACLTDARRRSHGRALRPTIACTPTRRNPSEGATPAGREHRHSPSGHSGRK